MLSSYIFCTHTHAHALVCMYACVCACEDVSVFVCFIVVVVVTLWICSLYIIMFFFYLNSFFIQLEKRLWLAHWGIYNSLYLDINRGIFTLIFPLWMGDFLEYNLFLVNKNVNLQGILIFFQIKDVSFIYIFGNFCFQYYCLLL